VTMLVESPIYASSNEFKGQRCWILGSGPSLDAIDLKKIGNDHILALNAAVTLVADSRRHQNVWWVYRDVRIVNEVFPVLWKCPWRNWRVITHKRAFAALRDTGVWRHRSCRAFIYPIEAIIHQKTVAEDAIQLAAILGFSEAYLVGIDCAAKDGKPYAKSLTWKECHFVDPKKPPVTEPMACKSMAAGLEALKSKLNGTIKVFNTSPIAPPIFPKIDFEEAVALRNR
jgi:hypothetical protein